MESNDSTLPQAAHTLALLAQSGLTRAQLARLHDGYLSDLLESAAQNSLPDRNDYRVALNLAPSLQLEGYVLTVDYNRTLSQMVYDGDYGFVNKSVYEILVNGAGVQKYDARLFRLSRAVMRTSEVCQLIAAADSARPWRPAKLEHLAAFGASYPHVQLGNDVVALDSYMLYGKDKHCPYLRKNYPGRELNLMTRDIVPWERQRNRLFLAVRECA